MTVIGITIFCKLKYNPFKLGSFGGDHGGLYISNK